jgi:hypothetical protein
VPVVIPVLVAVKPPVVTALEPVLDAPPVPVAAALPDSWYPESPLTS